MDRNEFLKIMEMDEMSEINYFEDIAHIFEIKEEIPLEFIEEILRKSEGSQVRDLIKEYFDEVTDSLEDTELYTLMTSILNVMSTYTDFTMEGNIENLGQEINRFRDWYLNEELVFSGEETTCVRDALCQERLEKLTGESLKYDFEKALDYELENYTVMVELGGESDGEEDEEYYDISEEEEYSDWLIDSKNPVIESEDIKPDEV